MKLKGLLLDPRTGIYYYQPRMAKGVRPPKISLRTKDREEAVEAYFRVDQEARRDFSAECLRLEAARYVQAKRGSGRHTARTSEVTEQTLAKFVDFTANPPIAAVRASHVIAFRDEMQSRGLSPATIKSEIGRIAGLFTWAQREGLIDTHPCRFVDLPRDIPTRSERYCTREERDRLVATVPGERPDLGLVLWLGFFAGLRKREITEARRDWVDLVGGVLHVRPTDTFVPKGKKSRTIRLSPRLAAYLAGYLETTEFGRSPYLLRPDKMPGKVKKSRGLKAWRYRFDPRRPFEIHCRRQGLEWVTCHAMRHTFATLHAIAGTPIATIAKELGDDHQLVFETYVGYTRHGDHAGAAD